MTSENNEQKYLDILYGRNLKIEILMITYSGFLCILGLLGASFAFMLFSNGSDKESVLMISFALLFLLSVIVLFIYMLAKHFQHCRKVKSEYQNLTSSQKSELLSLAQGYRSRTGIRYSDNYIYGTMNCIKNCRSKLPNIGCFMYVNMTEVAWIFKIQKTFVFAHNYSPLVKISKLPTEFCIYTYSGKCYKGTGNESEFPKLYDLLKVKSPGCRFGYRKEWEKEFKTG